MAVPTQYIGNYGDIGFGKETTFGTAASIANYYEFDSETFKTDPGWTPIPLINGTRAENTQSFGGPIKATGGLVLPFGPLNGPQLLAWALGTDTVTGSSAPYTHTLVPNEAGIPSFTAEKNLANLTSQQYVGCIIGKLDLECVTTAPAMMTLDILSQIDSLITPTTPSYVADTPYALKEITVSIFGSPNTNVFSAKLSIDNKATPVYTFSGQKYSTLNFSSGRAITGEVQVILQSMATQYTDAINGTYGALVFTLSQGSANQCVFTMPKIQWGIPDQPLKRGGLITQTLPFTVFYLAGQSYDLQAVAKNSVAGAYC